ncbi:putative RNA-directed DNA polymerase [Tanacetum coccineum]|uniref:RNA-directed DNA polymerase n=1 Tax=Tanacetum coccineum TaxID=301880 RepID=A0ABQ5A0P4_9ASTR
MFYCCAKLFLRFLTISEDYKRFDHYWICYLDSICYDMTALIAIGMLFILLALRYCIALLSYLNAGTATSFLYIDTMCYDDESVRHASCLRLGRGVTVLAKLLSSRLEKVIHKIIGPNQTAFIAGRQILDDVLIANGIINYASRNDLKLLLFKSDFEKAFESVNWSFLLDIMSQMGFGAKWCSWIKGCLSFATVSIHVNGSPSNEFKMERGLRQGDPLSPFLFLIVVEALQVSIIEACNKNLFKGLYLNEDNTNLSLLQYADDALFFGEWSLWNAKKLVMILKCFQDASGLRVNLAKSKLYEIGVNSVVILNCGFDSLPFIYLGLPVGMKMNCVESWNEVIDCFTNRISSWKTKILSIGSRMTLTKAVLGSLPLFYFSIFRAPSKVLQNLEKNHSRFFWGFKEGSKGISWVKWSKVCSNKSVGGLGVGSLKSMNLGLLGKWRWRFLNEHEALWRKVISVLYDYEGGFQNISRAGLKKGIWDGIVSSSLAIDDTAKVKDGWMMSNENGSSSWNWRSQPRGRALDVLNYIHNLLNGSQITAGSPNIWFWNYDSKETAARVEVSLAQKRSEDLKMLALDTTRMNAADATKIEECGGYFGVIGTTADVEALFPTA